MRLFESHVPARLPKALDEFPRDRPSGAAPAALRQGGSPAKPLSPDPAIGLKEPSQGTSPHLPDSRSLPAVFMAPYLPWRRASAKRRSTNAL